MALDILLTRSILGVVMSRAIILVGLVQTLAVILGFFGLCIVMRAHGYPGGPPQVLSSARWSFLALFLRGYGFVLLLVPFTWTVFAGISEKRARFILPFNVWMILGTVIPVAIIAVFFYTILNPSIAVRN
jgi:hypothetical protein